MEKSKPKIFHLGLCVATVLNDMQQAFIDVASEYRELSTGHPDVNNEALKICSEFKPDLVFMQIQAANIIHPATVAQLQAWGAKVLNWTGDVRASVPQWMLSFGADVTLFSNMRDVHEMRATGQRAEYLEIGYDPNIYKSEGRITQIKPVVFFGNSYGSQMFPMSQYRIEMVSFLKATYKGLFGVYGTGWNLSSGNFNSSQNDEAAAYRGAKIAINCSHFEIERYSSDRLFRILGTGTPICLAKWYPGIEQDFIDGEHLRTWRDLYELNKLVQYYLDPVNEHERQAIAHNGMKLAQSKFTFKHMAENAIKIYETL